MLRPLMFWRGHKWTRDEREAAILAGVIVLCAVTVAVMMHLSRLAGQ